MDEDNQYGMAMTRPLPYGCIKRKKKVLSIEELTVTLEDKIGHIFTTDIDFFTHLFLKKRRKYLPTKDLRFK